MFAGGIGSPQAGPQLGMAAQAQLSSAGTKHQEMILARAVSPVADATGELAGVGALACAGFDEFRGNGPRHAAYGMGSGGRPAGLVDVARAT